MICDKCRTAGNLLVAVDLSYDFTTDDDVEEAASLHEKCPGGTWCDCQHKTDLLVRRPGA